MIKSHNILPAPSISTLQYALGLHTVVPKIEAYYSWYEQTTDSAQLGVEGCGSWVEWKGKVFCDVEGLRRDMEMSIEDGEIHPCAFYTSRQASLTDND